jgi:hypothetical protein
VSGARDGCTKKKVEEVIVGDVLVETDGATLEVTEIWRRGPIVYLNYQRGGPVPVNTWAGVAAGLSVWVERPHCRLKAEGES